MNNGAIKEENILLGSGKNCDELTSPSPSDILQNHPLPDPEKLQDRSHSDVISGSHAAKSHAQPENSALSTNELRSLHHTGHLSHGDHLSSTRETGIDSFDRALFPPSVNQQIALEEQSHQSPAHLQRPSRLLIELYTICYLVIFSILGTLARLGLSSLTFYPRAPIQMGVLWANFTGCLVMGFLTEDRRLFRKEWGLLTGGEREITFKPRDEEDEERQGRTSESIADGATRKKKQYDQVKKTIPIYVGFTTGFCGSLTSFSSFIRDAFFALSNSAPVPTSTNASTPVGLNVTDSQNGGYNFMSLIAVLLVTVILSLGALHFGAHLANALQSFTPNISYPFCRNLLDKMAVFLACGMWIAAILIAVWPPDRPDSSTASPTTTWSQETWRGKALFAIVFAPPGCLLRFYASIHLNGRVAAFPLGTFIVNVLGTALLGMLLDLQHAPLNNSMPRDVIGGGQVGCQVLQGAMDGFCGCLTTVSTWVVELKGLRRRQSYIYGGLSIGSALALLVVVMGSLKWTHGFANPACVT